MEGLGARGGQEDGGNTMKRGDRVRVYDSLGNIVDAVCMGISYRKEPKHWKFRVEKRVEGTKKGSRVVFWYLPESRILK